MSQNNDVMLKEELINFLYELQDNNIILWCGQEGRIKSASKNKIGDSDSRKIRENKIAIYQLLKNNNLTQKYNIPFIYNVDNNCLSLSFAQERLWFIEQYEGGTNAYNIPLVLELNNDVDISAFKRSLQSIVERHEILRTVFKQKNDGSYYQKVLSELLDINVKEIISDELNDKLNEDINVIFHLQDEYPVKVSIYRVRNKCYCTIIFHHIAFDGWSADIFLRELNAFYRHYADKAELNLPKLDVYYKDFSIWQKNYLSGEILDNQVSYWKNRLEGYEALNFPIDKTRPSEIDYTGNDFCFEIDEKTSLKLKSLAAEKKTTVYNILLSAFYILLYKYTDQYDLVLGTPIANRHYSQLENMIGFFVNSLVLRINIESSDTFESLSGKVIKLMSEAQEHQDLPFEKLVDILDVSKDFSRHPIFQIMFSVQSFGSSYSSDFFRVVDIHDHYKIAKFDLSLFIDDSKEKFHCNLNYATSLFRMERIKSLSVHYQNILKIITDSSEIKLSEINLLGESEYNQIVYDWNRTEAAYQKTKTIHQLFEEQVEKTPDNVALIFGGQELTYRELNERSNQLAHTIRKDHMERWGKEIKGDTLIGIYVERSLEMIIGILGILKAGGAYVPFDRADPEERLKFKINDCGCKMVITTSDSLENLLFLTETDTVPLAIDSYWEEIAKSPATNPARINKPTDLAYVIYTSGSTGNPKGVMIEHKTVINYINNLELSTIKNLKIVDFSTSLNFDLSVTTSVAPLLIGNTVAIYRGDIKNIDEYIDHLISNKVSFVKMVPSLLYMITDKLKNSFVKEVFVGGEKLERKLIEDIADIKIYDEYGPTETTVGATLSLVKPDNQPGIGKAYKNYTLYVLDSNFNPVPIGVPGELYIGGDGLARGYLKRPELTAKRFIANPFATDDDKAKGRNLINYKTGDIVRWLPDGNLEFIGRNDDQIKIRGFRVELGEVESKLSEHSSISQCVVLCKERDSGNKYLAAYYIMTNSGQRVTDDELRIYLSVKLPDYMVPSFFVNMEEFPLSTGGKINKKALPDPEFKADKGSYIAPRTKLERELAVIWQEILGIERVGISDDFFRLGGNSLLIIKLQYLIKVRLDIEVLINDLLKNPTIDSISAFIKANKDLISHHSTRKDSKVRQNGFSENASSNGFPLSPVQARFFRRNLNDPHIFNIPILLKFKNNIDPNIFLKALEKIFKIHPALTVKFKKIQTKNIWMQYYGSYSKKEFYSYCDLSCQDIKAHKNIVDKYCNSEKMKFNLEKGPLFKVIFFDNYNYKEQRVFLVFHHLVTDDYSNGLILKDLKNIYHKFIAGNSQMKLPDDISYEYWCCYLNDNINSSAFNDKREYWKKLLHGGKSLNVDYSEHVLANHADMKNYNVDLLDQREVTSLINAAKKKYQTKINDILLSAFYLANIDIKGREDLLFHVMSSQRDIQINGINPDKTVGFFAGAFPVRINVPEISFKNNYLSNHDIVKTIKNILMNAPDGGLSYLLLKYLSAKNYASGFDLTDKSHVLFHMNRAKVDDDDFYEYLSHTLTLRNSPKNNKSAYLLNITANLYDNKLNMNYYYSSKHFNFKTIKLLSEAFSKRIRDLIS